jgi:hypothetical protein
LAPEGAAARGNGLGEGRGAVFIPEKIRGAALTFSESQHLAQPLCPTTLLCLQWPAFLVFFTFAVKRLARKRKSIKNDEKD